jgi:SAM-dependent methyltransferase
MSEFSQALIARSGYGAGGFAGTYDGSRPAPPETLLDVLAHVARAPRPHLVVDLGCGTGLSTRAWSARSREAIGIEANPAMVGHARAVTSAANVRYVESTADDTTLPGGRADLVSCAQSFHWMEPGPVLAEAARLLRPGGVFAAYDYDWPPSIEPEIDEAFDAHQAARGDARRRLGIEAGAATWPKDGHLRQILSAGVFGHARELVCHGWDEVDAARVIGLAESIGGPRAIFGDRAPAVTETFERLRQVAERVLADRRVPMLLCYRIRVGIV